MSTIIGLVWGVVCIVVSILLSGKLGAYFDLPSIFVTVGGLIAATVVSYSFDTLKGLGKIIPMAFKSKKVNFLEDIENIIKIANVARREGILALEDTVKEMDDPFMQKGIMLIIDGSDPELVKSVLETELAFVKERHSSGQAILLQMSSYSPAYGMIGTLIGLINMLGDLNDMESLGPNMAVALVTTFYGCVLANLLFTPMAKKLEAQTNDECLRKELVIEGILSIQDGENPRIIREKLNAFLPYSVIKEMEKKSGNSERSGE